MAYAAYPHARTPARNALRTDCRTPFVVVEVLADTAEAAHVRHAVSACACSGVLRCIPLLNAGRVRLQIRCPACEVAHLMREVMHRTMAAEFGRTATWDHHLATYQHSRHS